MSKPITTMFAQSVYHGALYADRKTYERALDGAAALRASVTRAPKPDLVAQETLDHVAQEKLDHVPDVTAAPAFRMR